MRIAEANWFVSAFVSELSAANTAGIPEKIRESIVRRTSVFFIFFAL
jgi:hypothetical protein